MSNIALNTAKNSMQTAVPFQIEAKVDSPKVNGDFSSIMNSEKNSLSERSAPKPSKNSSIGETDNKYEYLKIEKNNDLAGTLGVEGVNVREELAKILANFEVLSEEDLNENNSTDEEVLSVEVAEKEGNPDESSVKNSKIAQLILAMANSENSEGSQAIAENVEEVQPIQKPAFITENLFKDLETVLQNIGSSTVENVNDEALLSGIKKLLESVKSLSDEALVSDDVAIDEESFATLLANIDKELANISSSMAEGDDGLINPDVSLAKSEETIAKLRATIAQLSQESSSNKEVKQQATPASTENVQAEKSSDLQPKVEVSKEQVQVQNQVEAPKVATVATPTVVTTAKPVLENVKIEDSKVAKSEEPLSHMQDEGESLKDVDTLEFSSNTQDDGNFDEPKQKQASSAAPIVEESKNSTASNVQNLKESVTKQEAYNLREAKDITKLVKLIESQSKGGESKLTVTLTPENLGRLEVRLSEVGGKVSAKFFTDNETSHKMMLSQSEALRNQLTEKGIVIDNMEFAFNDTTSKEQAGQEERRAKRQGSGKGGFKDNEEQANTEQDSKPKGVYA